jgi:hypothetical protein
MKAAGELNTGMLAGALQQAQNKDKWPELYTHLKMRSQ